MAQETFALRRCPSMSDLNAQFDDWHLDPGDDGDDATPNDHGDSMAVDLSGSTLQQLVTVPDPVDFTLGSLSDDGHVFDLMIDHEARWELYDAPVEVVSCEHLLVAKNKIDVAVNLGELCRSASGAFR